MRKLLDTKAGATFYEEMSNLTLSTRKDCIEFIFKLKPGIYVIIRYPSHRPYRQQSIGQSGDASQ